MPSVAPLAECKFLFDHVVGFSDIRATACFEDLSSDTTDALLSEAGKVCEEVLAPLQRAGDIQHAVLKDGAVVMPDGLKEASLAAEPDSGRMRLARSYSKRLLPEHAGLLAHGREGADDFYALSTEDLLA